MTLRGIRLFAIGFVVLPVAATTGVIASAQKNAVPSSPAKQVSAADAAPAPLEVAAAPAPELPKHPAELPPKPPKVSCHGDQITISADNSTLDSILFAVRGCTGAKIDVPGDAGRVRSFEELGPGPVREVLDQLLSGTPYNYVIQSSEANPLKVETVLLSMRTDGPDKGGAGSNAISTDIPLTPGRRAWQKMQKFDKPDPASLNGDDTPTEADAATPAEEAAAAAAAANPSADASAAAATNPGDAPAVASAMTARPTTVAPPIANSGSGGDSGASVQERISQMQQMFAQRQQQMQQQKQGQPGAPNN